MAKSREELEKEYAEATTELGHYLMQGNSCPFYNLFHGLVYCATCGKSMQVRYEKVGRTNIDRSTKKSGSRLTEHTISARPITVWGRMLVPATKSRPATFIISFCRTSWSMAEWLYRTQKRSMNG